MPGEHDYRGSLWHRSNPHIHAPGTALNDQYGTDSFEAYLTAIENTSPGVAALGVTDYLSTACYQRVVDAVTNGGRLPRKLLFPNIELRLSIKQAKGKGINLHLLVSPMTQTTSPRLAASSVAWSSTTRVTSTTASETTWSCSARCSKEPY